MSKKVLIRKQMGGVTQQVLVDQSKPRTDARSDLAALRGGAYGLNPNTGREGFIPGAQLPGAAPTRMQRLGAGANLAGRGLAAALTGLQTAYGLQGGNVGALGSMKDQYRANVGGLTGGSPTEAQQGQNMAMDELARQNAEAAKNAMMQQATPPRQGNLTVGVPPPTHSSSSATTPAAPLPPPAGLATPPTSGVPPSHPGFVLSHTQTYPAQQPAAPAQPAQPAQTLHPLHPSLSPGGSQGPAAPAQAAPAPPVDPTLPQTLGGFGLENVQQTGTQLPPMQPQTPTGQNTFQNQLPEGQPPQPYQGDTNLTNTANLTPVNNPVSTPATAPVASGADNVPSTVPLPTVSESRIGLSPTTNTGGADVSAVRQEGFNFATGAEGGFNTAVPQYQQLGNVDFTPPVGGTINVGNSPFTTGPNGEIIDKRTGQVVSSSIKNAAFASQVLDEFGDMLHKADPHVAGALAMRVFLEKMLRK